MFPPYPNSSSTVFPRNFATSSARFNWLNPLTVARTILIGVLEPSDFDKISATPASSNTARTGPPAITPVPAEAGLKGCYQHQILRLFHVEL